MTYSRISPNRTSPRNHKIDTITIHCIVGQWTAEQGCDYFATTGRECSANYVVGKDGSIGLSVEEKDRSWCSSSRSNDHRAITIEVASDTRHPYKVTDQALAALIDLLVDICRRNGIKALLWKGDKSLIGQVDKQNMTVHRWFANKACPGDYLYNLHPQIAAQVNERLGAAAPAEPEKKPSQTPSGATFTPYLVRITASVLNIRKGPGTTYAVTGQIKDRGVYTIVEQKGNWGRLKSGAGWISLGAAAPAEPEKKPSQTPSGATFTPYLVRITASVLNIRKGPGTTYAVTGQIKDRGVYTIVEQKGNWGRLKSGAGWISLSYTKKV